MNKNKIILGVVIVVIVAAGATAFLLYRPVQQFAAAKLPQVVKPNPFQAFIDLYSTSSEFVACLQSKMGDAFNAAYSEGIVTSSTQKLMSSSGCVNTSTTALTLSTGAPPSVQQCLKDALGSDMNKYLNDSSFGLTPDENIKLNSCPAVKEFTDATFKLALYVKSEEDAAVNAAGGADLPKTGAFAASSTAKDVSVSAEVLESDGIINSNWGGLNVFGPARIKVTMSANKSGCSFSVANNGWVALKSTSTNTAYFTPDSILSINTTCTNENGAMIMNEPSYTIISYKQGDYGKLYRGGGTFLLPMGDEGGASDTIIMAPINLTK